MIMTWTWILWMYIPQHGNIIWNIIAKNETGMWRTGSTKNHKISINI